MSDDDNSDGPKSAFEGLKNVGSQPRTLLGHVYKQLKAADANVSWKTIWPVYRKLRSHPEITGNYSEIRNKLDNATDITEVTEPNFPGGFLPSQSYRDALEKEEVRSHVNFSMRHRDGYHYPHPAAHDLSSVIPLDTEPVSNPDANAMLSFEVLDNAADNVTTQEQKASAPEKSTSADSPMRRRNSYDDTRRHDLYRGDD